MNTRRQHGILAVSAFCQRVLALYALVIFDWDGTLIDSADRIVCSMQAAARDLAHPALEPDAVRNIIGLGLPEAIQQLLPGATAETVEAMRERYSHHFLSQDQTPCPLFPGVEVGLRWLRAAGYRLAVATGKSRRGLDRAFRDTGLGPLFEFSRCADETRSKPHPLMLEELLAESGCSASQALMIGDTEYDLEMASNAGVDSVAVTYGVHAPDRLARHGPRQQVGTFGELIGWFDGLKQRQLAP